MTNNETLDIIEFCYNRDGMFKIYLYGADIIKYILKNHISNFDVHNIYKKGLTKEKINYDLYLLPDIELTIRLFIKENHSDEMSVAVSKNGKELLNNVYYQYSELSSYSFYVY